jgi:pyrroloquinoline quinone biosynthesis protein E
MTLEPPLAVLLELTHRCPLQCPYCSNPIDLARAGEELSTDAWGDVLRQAARLGVLQVHFSGGEPAARKDLEQLVSVAHEVDLYTNLITSGLLIDAQRLAQLAERGLDHVQLSIQDSDAASADKIAGYQGAFAKKQSFARAVRTLDMPLTVNIVIHRHNIDRVSALIDMAVSLGAGRVEIAHVQYYGWGIANRRALMPKFEDVTKAVGLVEAARERLKGVILIDHVVPDYYAARPKACMGGWGRRFLVIDPRGNVMPCHAASSIPGLTFENVTRTPLETIWRESQAFTKFRGTEWMPEPCRSCERREIDWGGCRCQAYALSGNAAATDPVCGLAPDHDRIRALAIAEANGPAPAFRYRRIGG